MIINMVDFPHPLGPMTQTNSPSAISRFTFSMAWTWREWPKPSLTTNVF